MSALLVYTVIAYSLCILSLVFAWALLYVHQNQVVLDRSGGKSLGVKLLKGGNGKGASVKSIDAGSQAEDFPQITVGRVITHINSQNITDMTMEDIGGVIKSADRTEMRFRDGRAKDDGYVHVTPRRQPEPAPVPVPLPVTSLNQVRRQSTEQSFHQSRKTSLMDTSSLSPASVLPETHPAMLTKKSPSTSIPTSFDTLSNLQKDWCIHVVEIWLPVCKTIQGIIVDHAGIFDQKVCLSAEHST